MNTIGIAMQKYWFYWVLQLTEEVWHFPCEKLSKFQRYYFSLDHCICLYGGEWRCNHSTLSSSAIFPTPSNRICDTVGEVRLHSVQSHLIFNWTRYFDMHNACRWLEPAGELWEAGLGPSNAGSDNVSHSGWCSLQTRARHTSSTNLNLDC